MAAIPVIALTGYLGAGKTSLLNHVLRAPGARIGVVINDFGELNVDAALVTGQIDEPASITGGCICCLPDEGGLDGALEKLTDPRLGLDAIIVEASGLADPVALARMIRFSGVEHIRPGGVIDVIDAATHFDTVDRDGTPPARYGAASLIVVNKLDQIPEANRDAAVERIEMRVRERNPDAHVVGAIGARIDPALLYDVSDAGDDSGQMSFRELLIDADSDRHAPTRTTTTTCTPFRSPRPATDASTRLSSSTCSRNRRRACTGSRAPWPSATAPACAHTSSTWSAPRSTSRARRGRRPPTAWWRSARASTSTTFAPESMPRCDRTTGQCPPRASVASSDTGGSAFKELPADKLGAMEATR